MRSFNFATDVPEVHTRARILTAAKHLFARKGFSGASTRDLAQAARVAEGTIFRHFPNKKAILIELATQGWVEILTDLLTELSEMGSYKAVGQVMRRRMLAMPKNWELWQVCFVEAQYHPELRDRIKEEVLDKMMDVAEAFFQTAMDKGIYRRMNPRLIAQVFVGMFAIAGFGHYSVLEEGASPKEELEMAEGVADIFLHGVLAKN